MKLTVDGVEQEHDGEATLTALLTAVGADPERVAVMVNDEVIPKAKRAELRLREGDRVELLTFAGGG